MSSITTVVSSKFSFYMSKGEYKAFGTCLLEAWGLNSVAQEYKSKNILVK